MVTEYGMSKTLGPLAFGRKEELVFLGREISEQRNYSDEIAFKIDTEIRQIVDAAYARAKTVVVEHRDKLDAIASLLIERETLEGSDIEALFDSPRPVPTLVGPLGSAPTQQEGDRADRREATPTPRLRVQPASG
jgi:cell division protease FtsH